MKIQHSIFILPFIIFLSAQAQFNWESYKPETMDSLRIIHSEILEVDSTKEGITDVRISSRSNKYRLLVEYSDSIRIMREPIKKMCDFWISGIMQRPEMKKAYLHEILVQIENKYYWIPIQEVLVSLLKDEVKRGSKFYIYVILIGSIYNDLIFSINEFNTEL
jgi:hypothetical protein